MGTRADFYIGKDEAAEWVGSIAWDGYPDGIVPQGKVQEWPEGKHLFHSGTEAEFRERLALFFVNRTDVTLPVQGWPWPWKDSGTTDYAYSFHDGSVWYASFGGRWIPAGQPYPEEGADQSQFKKVRFPDMTKVQNVTFGPRSGVTILGGM